MELELIGWEGGASPAADDICRQLRTEGYDAFSWTDAPGAVHAPHQHPHDECLWMVSGKMEFHICGAAYLLTPGGRLMLPRGTEHEARVIGTHPATYVIGQRA